MYQETTFDNGDAHAIICAIDVSFKNYHPIAYGTVAVNYVVFLGYVDDGGDILEQEQSGGTITLHDFFDPEKLKGEFVDLCKDFSGNHFNLPYFDLAPHAQSLIQSFLTELHRRFAEAVMEIF